VLRPDLDTLRRFAHVLSASIWVGGQIALAGVVGAVRRHAPTATGAVARGFARVAWPALAVAVVTGMWSLVEVDVANADGEYQTTVLLKISMAVLSGMFAAVHSIGKSKLALAVGGALGLLTALAAMFLGVLLAA
jgi:putative copper export protein